MNLPLHPNDVPVKVLLSGPFSPAQMKNASENEIFHRELVRSLLQFFRDNNIKYGGFDLDDATLDASPNLQAIPAIGVHPAHFKHERSTGPLPQKPTTVGFAINLKDKDTDFDATLATIKVDATPENTTVPMYVVKPSTEFMNTSEKEWLSVAFPKLFPFG